MGERDDLLVMIQQRLEAALGRGDLSGIITPQALGEARELTAVIKGDDVEALYNLGWLFLLRSQADTPDKDQSLAAAVEMFVSCFLLGVDNFPEPLLDVIMLRALPQAQMLLQQAMVSADLDLISGCVDLWQHMASAVSDESEFSAEILSGLGGALRVRFDRAGLSADLDGAIDASRAAVAAMPVDDPQRVTVLSNLGANLRARFEEGGATEDLSAAIAVGRAAVDAASEGQAGHTAALSNLGIALNALYEHTREPQDLEAAIETMRAVAEVTPADHPNRGVRLSNLGIALQDLFEISGNEADLDAAIEAGRDAARATPLGHPRYSVHLANLATALRMRFGRSGSADDLDNAIAVLTEAVEKSPADHRQYTDHLVALAGALQARFDHTGAGSDLDEAISVSRALLDVRPLDNPNRLERLTRLSSLIVARMERRDSLEDLDVLVEFARSGPIDDQARVTILTGLSDFLQRRFERVGSREDADATVDVSQLAVDLSRLDDPDHGQRLSRLGVALRSRFERGGDPVDLEDAIEAGEAAVSTVGPDHPDYGACLSNLALALRARFDRTGEHVDLDRAIEALRTCVRSGGRDALGTATSYSNLSTALFALFEVTGASDDLDAAIEACQTAVDAMPTDAEELPGPLTNLSVMLRHRFKRTGAWEDIDVAVDLGSKAVVLTPTDHPDRPMYLSNLGISLRVRYQTIGAREDMNAAIEVCKEAAHTIPEDHPARASYFSTLGIALMTRYLHTHAPTDLDAAVEAARAVYSLDVDQQNRRRGLTNLAAMLILRFEITHNDADLEEAITVCEEILDACPPEHPDTAMYLNNHALTRQKRFLHRGASADLDAAIESSEAAVRSISQNQGELATFSITLGQIRHTAFQQSGEHTDLAAAVDAFACAAHVDTAVPAARIFAARQAAALAASTDPARAADLLEEAVLLLPSVTPRRLKRGDQQDAMAQASGLAADAAALALSTGAPARQRAERAVRLLEAGRAVLLSQLLDTRSDLTELARHHRELAERFVRLRDRLDDTPETLATPLVLHGETDEDPVAERRTTAKELAELIAHIQSLPGFNTFALPPSLDELYAEAAYGPIVMVNISSFRSDALVLTDQDVIAIELPRLTPNAVTDQTITFLQALDRAISSGRPGDRIGAQKTLLEVLGWLWDNVAGPVLDLLNPEATPDDANWRRLWWIPGGLLNALPVHAAGHHGDPERPGQTVLDRVVSSYTPTIRALQHARRRIALSPTDLKRSLIVTMPVTPGIPGRLNHVPVEATVAAQNLPNPIILTDSAHEQAPTKANVLHWLPECSIAHFACHAFSDPDDPSHSRLLLRDHQENPLTVGSLVPVHLERVRLAYLSACHTAFTSRPELLDEALHLASAFQLAGFPQVIGTLWEIDDRVAVIFANDFYQALRSLTGALDTSRSAHALHQATRAARTNLLRTPSLWTAYLHVGP